MARDFQRTLAVVLAGVGLALMAPLQAEGHENGDSPRRIPFELVDDTLIAVPGSIGGLTDLRFLIDTGATRSYIDRRIARKLGLKAAAGGRPLHALDGRGRAERIVVPSLQFGTTRLDSISGLTTDLSGVCRSGRIDALIGLDLLRLQNFEIDYRSREIVFEPSEPISRDVPFSTVTPLLSVEALIQGRPVRLMVDTAASTVVLFPNRMRSRLPRFRLLGPAAVPNAVGMSLAREVDLGSVHLDRTPWPARALLVDVGAEAYQEFDGILGALPRALSRVQFDFRRGRLAWME